MPSQKTTRRITMLTTSFPQYEGDFAGSAICDLARQLVTQHQCQVTILIPYIHQTIDKPALSLPAGLTIKQISYFFPKRFQVLVDPPSGGIPAMLRKSWLAWCNLPFFFFFFAVAVLRHARTTDLFHAHWGPMGAIALGVKFIHRRPVVVSIRGSDLRTSFSLIRRVTSYSIRQAAQVIVLSQDFFDECKVIRGRTSGLHFIPNGVVASNQETVLEKRKRSPHAPIRIITVGRLIPERNHDLLIQALSKVGIKNETPFTLTIVGDGPTREKVAHLVGELGLDSVVTFTGLVTKEEVRKLLLENDLYVSPTSADNYGNAVVEAALHALPVITTRVGFPGELVKSPQMGFVIEPNNLSELVEALHSALLKREKLPEMGRALFDYATHLGLTWEACAKAVLHLYGEACT